MGTFYDCSFFFTVIYGALNIDYTIDMHCNSFSKAEEHGFG